MALARFTLPGTSFLTTQVADKDLMDMLVRELKDKTATGGAQRVQDEQQGVAAPPAARRNRAQSSGRRGLDSFELTFQRFSRAGPNFYV